MNGIGPKSLFVQQKIEVSKCISDSIMELSTAISDLITQYVVLDFALATRAIRLDNEGIPVDDEDNNLTISVQKEALMSHQCPIEIKTAILKNISLNPLQIRVFNQICKEIEDSGYRAILDNVDFRFIHVPGLNWGAVSIKNAIFHPHDHADLRNARLSQNE